MKVQDYNERLSNQKVHNLTNKPITSAMRNLLAKGTNFVPTPRFVRQEFVNDLQDYIRRVEWKNYFWKQDTHNTQSNEDAKLLKTFYIPTQNRLNPRQIPPTVVTGLKHMYKNAITQLNKLPPHTRNNLTHQERETLRELEKQRELVVLPADKNLGLVLLKHDTFHAACLKHVENKQEFSVIKQGVTTQQFKQFLSNLISTTPEYTNLNTRLTRYIRDYTATREAAEFYMLPKIHKSELGWRPIIPATGTWNACPAKVVDYYLQKIVKNTPSYLKNTTDLINTIEQLDTFTQDTLTEKIWLITADVEALYPSIPLREAFSITVDLVEKTYRNIALPLNKMLHWVLFNNTFKYANKTYLQLNGVATGSPVAPSVANLFMSHIENTALEKWKHKLLLYKRYIDDIIIIFKGTDLEVEECKCSFNNMHQKIKLTWIVDQQSTTFLDLIIYKGGRYPNKLDYKVHQKQLNNYLYLPWSSSHPANTKKGIILSETQRYVRNCSTFKEYFIVKKKFAYRLLRRGYPPAIINEMINKVKYKQREQLLKKYREKQDKQQQTQVQQQQTPSQNNTQPNNTQANNTQENKQKTSTIVFKTNYTTHLQLVCWSRLLNPQTILNKQVNCMTAYKKTKNLFAVCKRLLRSHTVAVQAPTGSNVTVN
jgi:hypothetical protein